MTCVPGMVTQPGRLRCGDLCSQLAFAQSGSWKALLRARAIENQCYVLGVNRVGKDPYCEYSGGTAGIDPYGKTLSACADGEEGFAEVVIDMEELQSFRKKFPVLNDADSFTLN